jgi:hypothetical protein
MTTRQDLLNPLTHAVQVRVTGGGGGQWWQTIAAFDVSEVAQQYARDCANCAAGSQYRVVALDTGEVAP